MTLLPICSADEAKLVSAYARHVVAAFSLLDEHAAGRTPLPILEIALKIGITGPAVLGQHALPAKLATAVLVGTEAQIGIADGLLPELESCISLLVVFGQVKVAGSSCGEQSGAVFLGTGHLLHDRDLVNDVVVQTAPTEFVLALPHSLHLLRFKPRFAQPAYSAGEGAADDDVLEVKFVDFLVGG